MTEQRTKTTTQSDRWSYLWLAMGILLTLFSTGKWIIPLAAWLASVFLIRFLRTQLVWRGCIVFLLAFAVALMIAWWGILPFPFIVGFMPVQALIASLPFLFDRLLAPRLKGFVATLVFPLGSTAIEFLSMTGSPMGSFGATAYTQYGNLALMQMVSVTGVWGLSLLMNWFASIANWAWERSFEWKAIWRGVALYGGILALVLVLGNVRLIFFHPEANTVRVAGLTAVEVRMEELMPLLKKDREAFRQKTTDIHQRYFEVTIREARAGAKIVVWSEVAGIGVEEDEAALIARGQDVARQEGVYLAMPLFTIYRDKQRPAENKLIILDSSGKIVMEHVKYGGNFLEGSLLGDGKLRTAETPYGTLSGVICWDNDFIATIRQAGRNGTDILLVPSHDWRAIDPMHAQMSVFRAIENGVSVFRQTDQGLSIATDPYGRVLAVEDHFTTSEHVMVTQVPTKGVFTLYSVIGDLFGWLAVAGFVIIAGWAVVRGRKAA